MSNLITITDIQEFKPISSNTDTTKKLKPFILEAQEFELRPFLSDEFYIDLLADFNASPSLVKYGDLFNGTVWEKNGTKYENPGLKAVLVYWSYARYLNRSNTNSTAFGMVKKTNPDSESLSEKTLNRLVDQSMSGANAYLNRVKFYLDCNSALFPLWDCGVVNKKTGGMRISAVGGNSKK